MKINILIKIFVGVFVVLLASVQVQSQTDKYGSRTKIKIPKDLDSYKFPVLPQVVENPNTDYTVLQQNFFLTLRDGVQMDASKFYPSEPNIYLPNGYPIVIKVHGYGGSKESLEQMAREQAMYNYVVYTYSVRGQGNSGGYSNLISTTEAQDLIEFVNYVKRDNIGGDSSKVLIMGGSQGGTLPYMASCMGMKVKAIVSAVTTPNFASSWIENGSIKTTFLWTVGYTPDIVRYNPTVESMLGWAFETGFRSDKWDSLAAHLPKNRDFDYMVYKNKTPILIENSWQDYFFNAHDAIESFPNIMAPKSVYLGAVMGHGGDYSDSENQWHMNFFNEFFYHYLWGWNQGLDTRADYHYALTTYPRNGNMWSFVHDSSNVWPIETVGLKRYYFNDQERLTPKKNARVNAGEDLPTGPLKDDLDMRKLVYTEFTGPEYDEMFQKEEVKFISTHAFTSPTKMIGTPEIRLTYSSNTDICQFNFQIYEITATGDTGFVSRINYTDRHYIKTVKKTVWFEGISHGHLFQAGSKIMVVITNLDTKKDDWFMRTNPHVLPILDRGTSRIYFNDSFIDIPLESPSGYSTMPGFVAGEPETEKGNPELLQNTPNPFNPSTKIKFSLPSDNNGIVSLKIYDMLGREVSTLVNQSLGKGSYEYNFNGAGLSSGIYFMRLTTSNFSDVKRMLLVK